MELNINNIITFEDNEEYIIMEKIIDNDVNYLMLANVNNPSDIIIQKEIINNHQISLIGIETEKEFNNIIIKFNNKINA